MQIPEELFTKWTALKSYGDYGKISKAHKILRNDITRAFKDKRCADEVFKAIADFYKKKEAEFKPLLENL